MRILKFIRYWLRLRSYALARWIDAYDNHTPRHEK